MSRLATERMTLEQAEEQILSSDRWLRNILARVGSRATVRPGMKVLDVGAAQGRTLIALDRRGFEAYGVEPADEARQVACELAAREGCHIVIEAGTAESLPFAADTFDLVIATSVMEHVVDLERSLAEIHRVLRPGGMFWFNSASAMSPF